MLRDQVVEHNVGASAVAQRAAAVQKNHERSRLGGIVLRRNVDRVIVRRARIELARLQLQARHGSLGNAGLRLRIGAQSIIGAGRGDRAEYDQDEGFHVGLSGKV